MSKSIPKPKNNDRINPKAVSDFKCVLVIIPLIQNVPKSPLTKAPNSNVLLSFAPVIKNAIAIPGNAACEIASPSKLCLRSTAKLPSIPVTAPKIAVPNVMVRSV